VSLDDVEELIPYIIDAAIEYGPDVYEFLSKNVSNPFST
jgi:hypothetical protein